MNNSKNLKPNLPKIVPYGQEDPETHWGFLNCRNKTVLDIGADYGSTAVFFLHKGAKKVIAVESNTEFFKKLQPLAAPIPNLIPFFKRVSCVNDFKNLLAQCNGGIVMKIDCEGCEAVLLNLDDNLFRKVSEYGIELHTFKVAQFEGNPYHGNIETLDTHFRDKFQRCGFKIMKEFNIGCCKVLHAKRQKLK